MSSSLHTHIHTHTCPLFTCCIKSGNERSPNSRNVSEVIGPALQSVFECISQNIAITPGKKCAVEKANACGVSPHGRKKRGGEEEGNEDSKRQITTGNRRKTQRQKQPEGSTQQAGRTKEERGGEVGKKHTGTQPWHAVEQTSAQSTTGDKATKHSKTETRWEKTQYRKFNKLKAFHLLRWFTRTHRLALDQSCRCEVCCGMRRTCKKHQRQHNTMR